MNILARCMDAGWQRLAFIGTTKHAGKTTALNGFLQAADEAGLTVGLCSIGLDGERLDTVLGVAKPAVFAAAGTIVASAERALEQSDATFEWIEAVGIHSPLGEVVLARVITPGQVLLAGVRQRQHVKLILERFHSLGCTLSLVDGAFDRIAAAAPELVDAAVLAVGAVAGKTVTDVVAYASGIIQRFQLPVTSDGLKEIFAGARDAGEIGIHLHGEVLQGEVSSNHAEDCDGDAAGQVRLLPRHQTVHGLAKHPDWSRAVDAVFLPGAVTDGLVEQFLQMEQQLHVVALHPAQVLASQSVLQRFYRQGNSMSMWHAMPLAAIAANPHHILGWDLPAAALREGLQRNAPDVPVYDAMDQGGIHGDA